MITNQKELSGSYVVGMDAVLFAINVLQFDGVANPILTDDQVEVLSLLSESYEGQIRIAVKGGHGTLKTTTQCIIALWRACQTENSLVIVTAPTMAQLKDVWMAECRKIVNGADSKFREVVTFPTRTSVRGTGDAFGRILMRASSKPENFSGYCSQHLTIIVDEASGISSNVFRAIRNEAANPGSLILAMGGPNTRDCMFFELFNCILWTHRTWSSENGPNPRGALAIEKDYGRDSDMYRIRVLGEFPTA